MITKERQLCPRDAAELLDISRPQLIRLLDAGEIPFHMTGRQRWILLRDAVAYGKRRAGIRRALNQIAREAFNAGLYENAAIPEGGSDI